MRAEVSRDFAVGIKLNCGDYIGDSRESTTLTDKEQLMLEHLRDIASWGNLDFIEISGGDYEQPGRMICVQWLFSF